MKTLLLIVSFVSYIASAKYFGIKDCRIFVDFIFYDLSEFSRYPIHQLTYNIAIISAFQTQISLS